MIIKNKDKLPKLSSDDPCLAVLNKMADALTPFSRVEQLRILASVCVQLNMLDYAKSFIQALEDAEQSK